jgi:putative pyruvate formate lyase activating enzyme
VNRLAGRRGRCGETAELRLASASIHRGEEPPISGGGGSGAIFVTGCGLGCVFCQNYQISRDGLGRAVATKEFAAIALALQAAGAENINIVTGSHAVPAIAAGLDQAGERGLCIPILWNSSAYEAEAALDLLRDRVDVYLPDLKTLDSRLGQLLFRAPDYPRCAAAAILRMLSFRGELRWKERAAGPRTPAGTAVAAGEGDDSAAPILARGVIIRHLIIPGYLESTREVIAWFSRHGRGRALLSLMTQYTPRGVDDPHPGTADGPNPRAPQRRLIREEYEQVMDWLVEFGVEEGFYQEPVNAARAGDWLPDFNRGNPFSSGLSRPLWHWKSPGPPGTGPGTVPL